MENIKNQLLGKKRESTGFKEFIGNFFKHDNLDNVPSQEDLYLFYPVYFRSTKHFTVNTPLGLASEYNGVPSNRTFTIIDDISNFLSSGYGYSLSLTDAYLDVTHKPLKISDKAFIIISIDDYNKLKNDKEIMNMLKERQLIVYKGDLALAINMFLTEKGILPFRTNHEYDDDLKQIITDSLKKYVNIMVCIMIIVIVVYLMMYILHGILIKKK